MMQVSSYIPPLFKTFQGVANPKSSTKAVLADISVHEYVAGCKALGIVKVITGPLWRVLECKEIAILDMNQ